MENVKSSMIIIITKWEAKTKTNFGKAVLFQAFISPAPLDRIELVSSCHRIDSWIPCLSKEITIAMMAHSMHALSRQVLQDQEEYALLQLMSYSYRKEHNSWTGKRKDSELPLHFSVHHTLSQKPQVHSAETDCAAPWTTNPFFQIEMGCG